MTSTDTSSRNIGDDELARLAYDSYGETTGYKNFQGNPMPAFNDLGDTIQNAWKAAVAAVRTAVISHVADDIDPD